MRNISEQQRRVEISNLILACVEAMERAELITPTNAEKALDPTDLKFVPFILKSLARSAMYGFTANMAAVVQVHNINIMSTAIKEMADQSKDVQQALEQFKDPALDPTADAINRLFLGMERGKDPDSDEPS